MRYEVAVVDISSEVLKVIDNIGKTCHSQIQRIAQITGLSEVQVVILREIQAHETINITNLNKIIKLSQYRINVQVEYLIEKNLIERVRDDVDKRAWNLMLSPKAISILESSSAIRQKLMIRFSNLPSWHQAQILATLQHLAELIEV